MAQKINKFINFHKDKFIIFGIYLLLGIIFTWPIITKLGTLIYGFKGDPFYNLWIFHNLRFNDLLVNVSFGLHDQSYILQPVQPLIILYGKILTYCFSDIITYNLIIIFSFPLAGLAIYLLTKLFTKNVLVSFFAGIIFAFSAYHLARAEQHISLVSIYWLAFFVYFLFKFWRDSNWKYAILCGLFFSLTLMDNYQYGFMALIVGLLFYAFLVVINYIKKEKKFWIYTKFFLLAIVAALSIISIFDFKIVRTIFSNQGATALGPERNISELPVYSAQKFNYILPSPENPILGKFAEEKYDQSIKDTGGNLTEQTLYLGIIPILLLLYCFIVILTDDKIQTRKYRLPVIFLSLLFLVGLYFSFAPTVEIFGLTIKTPASWIFPHLSVFRVYARFGLLVILSVSVLAGIGLSFLLEKIKSKKIVMLLYCSIALLLLLELLNFPPFHYVDVSKKAMPEVYQALENNLTGVLAEYPLLPSEEPKSYDYLLWQRYHKFPLVYGAPINSEGDEFRKTILDPSNNSTIEKLKEIGVKYIIIHQDSYTSENAKKYPLEYNNGVAPKVDNAQLELLGNFSEDTLYKIK